MVSIVLPHPYHVSDESTVAVAHKYWICFHLHPSFFLHHDILPQFSVCFFLGFHVLWKQDATGVGCIHHDLSPQPQVCLLGLHVLQEQDATGVGCMDSGLPMDSRVLTQQPFHVPSKSTTAVAHNMVGLASTSTHHSMY